MCSQHVPAFIVDACRDIWKDYMCGVRFYPSIFSQFHF